MYLEDIVPVGVKNTYIQVISYWSYNLHILDFCSQAEQRREIGYKAVTLRAAKLRDRDFPQRGLIHRGSFSFFSFLLLLLFFFTTTASTESLYCFRLLLAFHPSSLSAVVKIFSFLRVFPYTRRYIFRLSRFESFIQIIPIS